MENEIRFIKGCLDCPFYSWDGNLNILVDKAWCSALDKNIKYYVTNRMPKICPLRNKNITISGDIENA